MPNDDEYAAADATSGATAPLDGVDVAVLDQLRAVYDELDPPPQTLVERIQFGITLDALHAEVARLQRESKELAGARGDSSTDVQTVTFTSSGLTTMVTVAVISTERVRIDGWIAPGAGVAVELRTPAGSRRTAADEDGRFALEDVPRGYVQFVLTPPSDTGVQAVITPSIEV